MYFQIGKKFFVLQKNAQRRAPLHMLNGTLPYAKTTAS